MKITAIVKNEGTSHDVTVSTQGNEKTVAIPSKPGGGGSSVNGGELLFLALATCYTNDVYREAAKRKIAVTSLGVVVEGEFGKEGEPAKQIRYKVKLSADGLSEEEVRRFIREVDGIAENT